ncbi:MAG: putative 2-ketoarginine decarboxylase AruI [Syntrophorhabdaceae bacterium PtaU1.Bin034]|nr:MAG: putative 2-ketoarginine decarboxylase AruI [Syntrophorhabdaceae bacterium PtaU1.Bin034]
MLGKEAIIHFFEGKGIRNIFHLPGIHTLPLNDAFIRSNIQIIVGRHESNIAFMADGYSRSTGRPGVVLVSPGPGLGNVVTASMEAHNDDVPLLIIFIDAERKDAAKGVLHGLQEPEAIFTGISKSSFVVSGQTDLFTKLESAYRETMSGRPGPVIVSVPFGCLDKEVACASHRFVAHGGGSLDMRPMEKALHGKKKPVIIGGKGLMRAETRKLLGRLCREAGIPFLTTTSGKGVMSEDNPFVFGNVITKGVARDILRSADIAVALGTRLREVDAKRRGVRFGWLVHIDTDSRWLEKNYRTEVAVAADPNEAAGALYGILKGMRFSWDMEELNMRRLKEQEELQRNHEGFRIARCLRRLIPGNAVTVWDLSLIGYWAEYYFPVFEQRSFLTPRGISPIFYAFPASIGAKLGNPELPCICITGDGSFAPVAAELATIMKYGVPVVILVYNNGSFGVLEDYMRKRYGVQSTMDLHTPDFPALAGSYGIKAKRAENIDELEGIFLNDVHWDEPYLVEFRYPAFAPPWEQPGSVP